jgi:hypothetical protein
MNFYLAVCRPNKKILEFFKEKSPETHDFYKAGIYILLKKRTGIIAIPSIVRHVFFELSNVFEEMGRKSSENKFNRNRLINISKALKIFRPNAAMKIV